MDAEQVIRLVGRPELTAEGDAEQAALTIAGLVNARARLRAVTLLSRFIFREVDEGADLVNVLVKICKLWPNKPSDYTSFMADLRKQMFTRPGAEEIAPLIFTRNFLALSTTETLMMFGRSAFFSEQGTFRAFNPRRIPEQWEVVPLYGGMTSAL